MFIMGVRKLLEKEGSLLLKLLRPIGLMFETEYGKFLGLADIETDFLGGD